MTTGQAVVPRSRRPTGQHPKPRDPDGRKSTAKKLPEYLEAHQVEALIRCSRVSCRQSGSVVARARARVLCPYIQSFKTH